MNSGININVLAAIDMLGADRVLTIERSENLWKSKFADRSLDSPPERLIKRAAEKNKNREGDFFFVALQGLSIEEMWKFDQKSRSKHSRFFFSAAIKGRLLEMTYLSNELASPWATWKYTPRYELIDFSQHAFDMSANMVAEAAITVGKGDPSTLRYPLGMRQHPTSDLDSQGRRVWVGNQSPQGLVICAR